MVRVQLALCLILFFTESSDAFAEPFDIIYSARLTDNKGRPVTGPINVVVKFYDGSANGNQLGDSYPLNGVTLVDGLLQLSVPVSATDRVLILSPTADTWMEFTDLTHSRTYTRQKLGTVPRALSIPVDDTSIGFNSIGELTIKSNTTAGNQIVTTLNTSSTPISTSILPALGGDVMGSPGANTVAKIQGTPVSQPQSSADNGKYLKYDGTSFVLAALPSAGAGSVTNVTATLPLAVLNGTNTPAISMSQAGSGSDGYLASADWNIFNAKQPAGNYLTTVPWAIPGAMGSGTPNTGSFTTLTSTAQNGIELKPFNVASGNTSELRFDELSPNGTNYVGFKAPDSLAANKIWTLPNTDGMGGQLLSTNGSGLLGWVSKGNGTVTNIATGGALTGGPISGAGTIDLATIGVSAGTYTRANVTIDGYGRVVSAANGTAANLSTSDIGGILSVANGGTGGSAYAQNSVILGGTTLSSAAAGSAYQVFAVPSGGGAPAFSALNLDQSAAVTGILPASNGGTGVNSTASFPTSGVIVTETGSETLTSKTLAAAIINGASSIGGSTTINTTGTISAGATALAGNVTIQGNATTANKLILNDKGTTNGLSLKAPDLLAGSVTWTLPATDGTMGQILSTNGSGALSWTSTAAGNITSVATGTGLSGGPITSIGTLSLANTTVNAGTYTKANISVDAQGRLTAASAGSNSSLTADVTGILPVANGGTGGSTYNSNTVILGGAIFSAASGTANQVLRMSPGATPGFGAIDLTQSAAISGTLAVANGGTGVATLTSNGIVYGNGAGAAGITTAGAQYQVLQAGSGGTPAFGALNLAQSAAVTGALPIGNGGTGATTAAGGFDALSPMTAAGDMIYGGASGTRTVLSGNSLAIKKFLTSTGNGSAATAPAWGAIASTDVPWAAPGTIGSTTPSSGAFTTLATSGNLGVGTSAPAYKLEVAGSIKSNGGFVFPDGTTMTTMASTSVGSTSTTDLGFAADSDANGSGVMTFATKGIERMRITNDGNVGIGTTNPSGLLDVNRKLTVANSGNVGIGTTNPGAALDVLGQIHSMVYNAGGATSFDWNNGNIQYTTATCGSFSFSNIKDGGFYTLIVKSTTSGTCTFSQSGLTFRSPVLFVTAQGTYTIFTFITAGNDVFVSMRRGY